MYDLRDFLCLRLKMKPPQPTILLVCQTSLMSLLYALFGCDCTAWGMNHTALSLLDVGNCDLLNIHPETTYIKIQLVQTVDFQEIELRQFKIFIYLPMQLFRKSGTSGSGGSWISTQYYTRLLQTASSHWNIHMGRATRDFRNKSQLKFYSCHYTSRGHHQLQGRCLQWSVQVMVKRPTEEHNQNHSCRKPGQSEISKASEFTCHQAILANCRKPTVSTWKMGTLSGNNYPNIDATYGTSRSSPKG